MAFKQHEYDLLKSIFQVGRDNGHSAVYRNQALKHYSRTMREFDPSHNDSTRGDHVGAMMDQIALELGGNHTKDLTKNGNAKKNSVRIEF